MKRKKFLSVVMLSSVLTLGGIIGVSTLVSCSNSTNKVGITYDFDSTKGSVDGPSEAEAGTKIEFTITCNDGYVVDSVSGATLVSGSTYSYTVKESGNTITITFKEGVTLPFTLKSSLIVINMDDNPDGVALSNYIDWGNNTPEALSVLIPTDLEEVVSYNNGKLIGLKVGNGTIEISLASDTTQKVSVGLRITKNATELDEFNTNGDFPSSDVVKNYFDTTESNRLDEMKTGKNDSSAGENSINLWVADTISSSDELPKLVLKKTINGISANKVHTLGYKLSIGGYDTVEFKINGEKVNTNTTYSGTWTQYYHTFTPTVDSIEFELTICYSGELSALTGTLWGYIGKLSISEGNTIPQKEITTNYILDPEFEYMDQTNPDWTLTGDNGYCYYTGRWLGKGFYYDNWGLAAINTEAVSMVQEFTVKESGDYSFTSTITTGGGDNFSATFFDYFYVEIKNGDTSVAKNDTRKGDATSKDEATVLDVSLTKDITYTIGIYLKENQERTLSEKPYAAVTNLAITKKDTDNNVIINGYKEVKENASITLTSNRPATWSLTNETEGVTLTSSEDGYSCTVTGKEVGNDYEIKATSQSDTNYYSTFEVDVLSSYEVPVDTNTIKDASFDYSGRLGRLTDYWTLSGDKGEATVEFDDTDSTITDEDSKEYRLNLWGGSTANFEITQDITITEEGYYKLSASNFMGSVGKVILRDGETEINSFSCVDWSDDTSKQGNYFYAKLDAKTYTLVISYDGSENSSNPWLQVDGLAIEKVDVVKNSITASSSEITVGDSTTLTSTVASSWSVKNSEDASKVSLTVSSDGLTCSVSCLSEGSVTIVASDLREGIDNSAEISLTIAAASTFTLSASKTSAFGTETITFGGSGLTSLSVENNSDITISGTSWTLPDVTSKTTYTVVGTDSKGTTSSVDITVYPKTIVNEDYTDADSIDTTYYTVTDDGNGNCWAYIGEADSNKSLILGCSSDPTYTADSGTVMYITRTITIEKDSTYTFAYYLNAWGGIYPKMSLLNSEGTSVSGDIWKMEWDGDHTSTSTDLTLTAGTYTLKLEAIAYEASAGQVILDNLSLVAML